MKVGFIGLGLMGHPMAKNILKNGFSLVVHNRTSSKCQELKKLGALVAFSPKELTQQVDLVISMVTAPKDVKAVYFGRQGVVAGKHQNLIVIDMSTIGPSAARDVGLKLEKIGIDFLDAPVTGSTPKAINGELTIFVGGKKKIYEKVTPVLKAMGKSIHYMGESGSGQAIKMINNQILALTIASVAEGMLLADEMKLSRAKVAEALKTAPVMSIMMNLKSTNYVQNQFPLFFSMANMEKDLVLALNEVSDNVDLPLLKLGRRIYQKALEEGLAQEDFSVIIKSLKNSKI